MQRSEFRAGARRGAARGFTMAELMAVVAIVGILAMLSTVSYRKYVAHSKTAEVPGMFLNIKIAEESYKDETFQYLGPSADLSSYYPNNSLPGRQKMNFAGAGNGSALWQRLGVQATAPVLFVYACTAGANSAPTPLGSDITVGNWPATVAAPWYVVKARADIYGNGADTVFATSSFSGELFSAND
jgi:prepilin-type N-terminal cleavage/methylation domain-containing protein